MVHLWNASEINELSALIFHSCKVSAKSTFCTLYSGEPVEALGLRISGTTGNGMKTRSCLKLYLQRILASTPQGHDPDLSSKPERSRPICKEPDS